MENVVLKANRYRIVDNSAFEMPLPLKFTVWKCEAPICEYLVSEDEEVSYTIITRFKELMITTIHRPLDISDIYYLFSCRVFQDKTPYTYPILDRMGIEKYNVYNILRRTHGITPYDDYWIRFDGETTTFEQACGEFDKYLIAPEAQPVPMISYPSGEYRPGRSTRPPKQPEADVSSILNQHKVDVASIMEESKTPEAIAPETSYAPAHEVENNKMSQDDIEALLRSAGISDSPAPEPVSDIQVDPATRSQEESSGGVMSQDEVQRMLDEMNMSGGSEKPAESVEPVEPAEPAEPAEPVETPTEEIIEPAEPSGGKMSQDDIEKLLSAALGGNDDSDSDEPEIVENNAPEAPVNDEPAPAESSAPSGGKMSQEDIEKLLAANAPAEPSEPAEPAEPVPAPEPAPAESSAPSGGKMSQEDIEKLLAANAPAEPAEPTEPAPAPEPAESSAPSGGKMSQEDIEKLLAANAPAEPSEPAEPTEPAEPVPAPEPAPAESPAPSGGKMSQEDIEKLLAANAPAEPSEPAEPTEPAEPVPAPEPAPAESSAPSGGKMSQEDIEKLLAANAPAEPSEPAAPAPEPAPAESSAPSGGKMSQADIEALLNSMQDEANK